MRIYFICNLYVYQSQITKNLKINEKSGCICPPGTALNAFFYLFLGSLLGIKVGRAVILLNFPLGQLTTLKPNKFCNKTVTLDL